VLRKTVRIVKLCWKNYYKYVPLIYDDLKILVPLSRTVIKEYRYRRTGVEGVRVVLNDVAKRLVAKFIWDILARRRGNEKTWQTSKKTLESVGSRYAKVAIKVYA